MSILSRVVLLLVATVPGAVLSPALAQRRGRGGGLVVVSPAFLYGYGFPYGGGYPYGGYPFGVFPYGGLPGFTAPGVEGAYEGGVFPQGGGDSGGRGFGGAYGGYGSTGYGGRVAPAAAAAPFAPPPLNGGPIGTSTTRCFAGAYMCPADPPGDAGSPCSCPTGRSRASGRIG